ncbi:MAG: TetR/AcrR family transcriptional regulator [Acidimicrobiales bacterium]
MRDLPANIAEKLPAAATVFAELGFDQTRMEDVATGCGIPKPTLYYHFKGKEEILSWLLERLLRDLSTDISAILDDAQPARARLTQMFTVYLQLFADHPDVCHVLLSELGRITRIPELADSIWSAFHEPMRKVLDEGQRDGTLRDLDPEATASAVFGSVTMVGLHYVVTGQPLIVDHLVAQLDELLVGGLATPTPPTKKKGPR